MSKLRELARGRDCQVRLPGCDGGGPSETTILAHIRMAGISGLGFKAPDALGAHCCAICHSYADTHHDAETQLAFYKGVIRTIDLLIREGHIK